MIPVCAVKKAFQNGFGRLSDRIGDLKIGADLID
jgi:hypothetical protein